MSDVELFIERMGELEREKARAYLKLLLPDLQTVPAMLSTDQAATLLGRSKSWLIKRKDQFGGVQACEGCKVEWPRKAIEDYLRQNPR